MLSELVSPYVFELLAFTFTTPITLLFPAFDSTSAVTRTLYYLCGRMGGNGTDTATVLKGLPTTKIKKKIKNKNLFTVAQAPGGDGLGTAGRSDMVAESRSLSEIRGRGKLER